ncbi:MAG: hypothetical protein JSS66_11900 [Armatimonadetes bacterium]|nr:hypothetical protein [Armatimonadota bacterium]
MKVSAAFLTALCFMVLGAGCQKKQEFVYNAPQETSYSREPDNPDAALEEQLRSGSVQMAAASDSIQAALDEAKRVVKKLSGDAKESAQDVVDFLDSAGEGVADAAAEPPDGAAIKKDFSAADDERKKRIATGNDAYKDMEEALGTVTDMKGQVDGLSSLEKLVTLAIDDLGDAIEAYGGKVESEADSEPSK